MSTVTRTRKSVKAAPAVSLCMALDHVPFLLTVIPCHGFGSRAVRMVKQGGDGATYDVLVESDRCTCTCADWTMRRAEDGSNCKHINGLISCGMIEAPDARRYPTPADVAIAPARTLPPVAPIVEPPAPARVDATEWAMKVGGRLAGFATSEQLAFARELLCDDNLIGRTIEPIGPSLDELEALQRAARAAAVESPAPCCDPATEAVPCLGCSTHEVPAAPEADPLTEWVRPARRSYLRVIEPSPRPLKPAPLPDGSRFTVIELIEAQASYFLGQESAPFTMMAEALHRLASDFKATGAASVAEFTDRLAVMEAERVERLQYDAFDAGFRQAEAQFLTASA